MYRQGKVGYELNDQRCNGISISITEIVVGANILNAIKIYVGKHDHKE